MRHKREDVKEELDEDDLAKIVELDLVETETIWLLDIPGVCVASDGDDAPLVQEQLARYQEVRTLSRVRNLNLTLEKWAICTCL